jgi:hypothetical protein
MLDLYRSPFILEAVEPGFRLLMRQLFGVAERLFDDRLDRPVTAATIGAAPKATINCARGAGTHVAVERIPNLRVGNGVAGTDNH